VRGLEAAAGARRRERDAGVLGQNRSLHAAGLCRWRCENDRVTRIAVVGSYGVGLTFGVERAPDRGETLVGTLFRTDHGGKGSNQAVGAARLGAGVVLLTAVGEDSFGDGAFELWAEEGVDATGVVRA